MYDENLFSRVLYNYFHMRTKLFWLQAAEEIAFGLNKVLL